MLPARIYVRMLTPFRLIRAIVVMVSAIKTVT